MSYDLEEHLPEKLPGGWRRLNDPQRVRAAIEKLKAAEEVIQVAHYRHRDGLVVLVSIDDHRKDDAGVWIHVSCSRSTSLPRWRDLKQVKNLFFGEEGVAIQVMAPRSHWIDAHPYCLHLWQRIDAPTLPRAIWDQGQ